jgi:hypothetical protein
VKRLLLSLLLILCGCRDQSPPAPTSEQSDQLNEAESMLNDMSANKGGSVDRSKP